MNITSKKTFPGIYGQYIAEEEKNGSYTAVLAGEKYYITKLPDKKAENVERMIALKAPRRLNGSVEDRILWPSEILDSDGAKWCALKSPKPDSFKNCTASLYDLLSAHIRLSPAVIYSICANVTEVYSLLSTLDLYFNIYSIDDIMFDTRNGEICIKNSHMLLSGTDVKDIKGTPLFMAPETVEGIAGINRFTNIYSCLTYLFCLIYRVHPLHGEERYRYPEGYALPDSTAIKKIYGTECEFCFAKSDNAPIEAAEALGWKETDDKVRELFKKLYTTGIKEYKARDTLQNAYNVFSSVGGSLRSASIFTRNLFTAPFKAPTDDAAKKIAINNSSMNCNFDLADHAATASQILNKIANIDVSITERNGYFYLINQSVLPFKYHLEGNIIKNIASFGNDIKLVRGLIIELPTDNNITVLKLL